MTLDRHTLAERLRPHLSPTEPRLASELLVLAGVQTGSRVGGTVAAALQELRAAGHARPAGGTRQALRWLASAPGDLGSETLPLARLDATLTLTTTARTTAGGTRRTELAATVTLGPSWPATTPTPPRWSTALNDAQVAGGALAGARTNAITRAEAQLRALRTSKTNLPALHTETPMTNPHRPNPLLLPSKDREDFLAYLASVTRGARQDSACAWLAKRSLARTTSEATAWLEEAVEAGVLAERQSAASDGTVVLRYSPADPSVKPAPLPKSSAPAEEAPPAIEEDPGDPADDSGAEDDPKALEEEDPPEEGEIEKVRHKLWEAQSKIKSLEEQVKDWDRRHREADRAAARELAEANAAIDELKFDSGVYYEALTRAVPHLRGASAARVAEWLEEAASAALHARAVYQPDPAEAFAASTASWLVSLRPLMALGDRIDLALREHGAWYDEGQLQAAIREGEPLGQQHSDRDWRGVLKDMLRSKRIERREEGGRVQFRTAPLPAKKPAPEAPRPTVTVGEAVSKLLAETPPQRWAKVRALVADRLAGNRGYPIPVAGLYLSADHGSEIDAVMELLEEAGATHRHLSTVGHQRMIETGAAVDEDGEKSIQEQMLALTHAYVLDLVVAYHGHPTTDDMASWLELPRGLVLSVLDELKESGALTRGNGGRWQVVKKAPAPRLPAPSAEDIEAAVLAALKGQTAPRLLADLNEDTTAGLEASGFQAPLWGELTEVVGALVDLGKVVLVKGPFADTYELATAQARTLPLIPGVNPAPASEEAPAE